MIELITESILLESDTILIFSDNIEKLYNEIEESEDLPLHYWYERGLTKYTFIWKTYNAIYLRFDREDCQAKESLKYFKTNNK